MKKSAGKFILFGLICAGWIGSADFAFCTTPTHTSLEPSSLVSGSGYQLAKTWFLPDWQADTRSYNTDGDNNTDEDNNGGDAGSSCATYGFQDIDTIDTSLYSCTVVQPVVGLKCYKSCFCKADFQYTSSNCSEDDGKILSGRTCDGLYESCICKPSVTLGAGEKCDLSCDGTCVEKSCAAAVEYDEENGEYCAESCASDSSVCTAAPQTAASALRRAVIRFAKTRLRETSRPTLIIRRKIVRIVREVMTSRRAGNVTSAIMRREVCARRTAHRVVMTPTRKRCRLMRNM